MVPSKIFQNDELIALQANYEKGLEKLYDFFNRGYFFPKIISHFVL